MIELFHSVIVLQEIDDIYFFPSRDMEDYKNYKNTKLIVKD